MGIHVHVYFIIGWSCGYRHFIIPYVRGSHVVSGDVYCFRSPAAWRQMRTVIAARPAVFIAHSPGDSDVALAVRMARPVFGPPFQVRIAWTITRTRAPDDNCISDPLF